MSCPRVPLPQEVVGDLTGGGGGPQGSVRELLSLAASGNPVGSKTIPHLMILDWCFWFEYLLRRVLSSGYL